MATIEIDIHDYLDEIDTHTLQSELRERGEPGALDCEDDLHDAHAALMRGGASEALCILDRILFPKWRSEAQCQAEYDRAMGNKKAA